MNFPELVTVTDQSVDLSNLTNIQRKYFIELAEHIERTYLASAVNRYIVSISGPSGSGKSVLGAILEELLKGKDAFTCYTLDLDAFHFSKAELTAKNLIAFKGRHDTYNIELLIKLLRSFKNNDEVRFPRYSRADHDVHSDGIIVQPGNAILLLPGLWFQRDDDKWKEIREYINYSISLEGDSEKFKQNTIHRHMVGGRTKTDAEVFYNNSDFKNTEEIVKTSCPSDMTVPYFEDIQSEEDIKFL